MYDYLDRLPVGFWSIENLSSDQRLGHTKRPNEFDVVKGEAQKDLLHL